MRVIAMAAGVAAFLVADDLVLREEADGKAVAVKVGQRIVVELKGNITTGYGWQLAELKGEALEQVGKIEYLPDRPIRPGSGGKAVATFRAVKPGSAALKLVYVRPWEKDKPPAGTFSLSVTCSE